MNDRLLERCTIEFESCVAKLHSGVSDRCRISRTRFPLAPYEVEYTKSDIPWLIHEIRRAYDARAAFALEGPTWAQMLPLGDECTAFIRATGPMHLLGCYAFSLQLMGYDYFGHPRFYNFGCGVMAHPDAPKHVRDDPELQTEFPAKELPGLGSRMVWFGESLQPSERRQALERRITA
jgi:hypothetical protein